jgi:quercetin dioxygenase-like cupin family protein
MSRSKRRKDLRIDRWNAQRDGILSEETLRRKLEGLGYEATRYVYPQGTVFETHSHDVDKIDAVLSGCFLVTLLGQSVLLEPGDALHVPRRVPHQAEVVGPEPVVSLDAVRLDRVRGA